MDITITLNDKETSVLKSIAIKEQMTAEQYGKNIIKNFLKEQIRGIFQKEFNKKSDDELMQVFGKII